MPDMVDQEPEAAGAALQPTYSGRSIVVFAEDVTPLHMQQAIGAMDGASLVERSLMFEELGAAVVPIGFEFIGHLFDGGPSGVVTVAPERISHVAPFRRRPVPEPAPSALQVLGISHGSETGAGIRVAILDSGIRRDHPDFENRVVWRKRFVEDETDEDELGHGTHCAGIACGSALPRKGPRYGVAPTTQILAGKVASWYGTVLDASLFAGFRWARRSDAAVVNLSLGGSVLVGQTHSSAFEEIARRMLRKYRILLIAGAGNDPPSAQHPVHHPANCPSVLAVAALGLQHQGVSSESAVQVNADGEVNVAAPGTDIHSSDIFGDYSVRSGTSMAAAYATGVAALWAATGLRGSDLWDALVDNAVPVAGATREQVGSGLVQAP